MSSTSKGYQFTFNGDAVTAVYETHNGRTQVERIDWNET